MTVLHPVGPLPASVYWRRRVVVFAVLAALVLMIGALLGGAGGNRAAGDQGGGSAGTTLSASDTATTYQPISPAAASGTPAPIGQTAGGYAGPAAAAAGGDSTAAGSHPSTAPAVTAPATTAPPGPCQDSALRLTVQPAAASYRVGTMPVIRLIAQNVSATTCTRDLGAAQQEILLYAGKTRLWSSNDCYPEGQRNVLALHPQQRAISSVTWSGLTSRPGCTGTRTRVGPGRYQLVGRLGTLRSAPATLTLT